jgi:hypothetical protein
MSKKVECTVYGLCWDETGQPCVSMSHSYHGIMVVPVSALKEALEKVENDPDYKEEIE